MPTKSYKASNKANKKQYMSRNKAINIPSLRYGTDVGNNRLEIITNYD